MASVTRAAETHLYINSPPGETVGRGQEYYFDESNASFFAPRDLEGAIRANVVVERGVIDIDLGFVGRKLRDVFFRRELDAEIARMASFLGVSDGGGAAR